MKADEYSKLQKVLHALSALLIIWLLISGFYAAQISEVVRHKQFIGDFNVSLSLLLIPIFTLRFYVSFGRGFPAVLDVKNLTPWLVFFVHSLMYLTVVTVLVSGVLMMDKPISFFDVVSVPPPLSSSEMLEFFARLHTQACAVMALLLVVHVGAVIKHQLAGRAVIKRMFT